MVASAGVAEWVAVSSLVSAGRHGEAGLKEVDVVDPEVWIF
ncbi:hypothetical protein S-CBS3_gp36 [Synechococcus phage S-CBS3]|nr:hypothetical protein S-CBS3_gp36 [Synechococcus phage S-CBS3]ADF42494.1 hypothetical protein S-CBS3_gp36 [Synechococcus phage S-CBS3]